MKLFSKFTGILLLFALSLPQAWAFSDVPSGSWYESSVLELEKQGVVDSADLFNPEKELNRVELVKMVILALGGLEDSPLPSVPSFTDVPLNQWFGPYVEKASALKVITGYKNEDGTLTGYFKPENSVTRAEAVQVMVKAFGLTNDPATQISFPDVGQKDWFYNSVEVAFDHGLVKGYEDGLFKPHQAVTRAEMAKMLVQTLHSLSVKEPVEETPPLPPETIPPETPEIPPTPPETQTEVLFVPNSTPVIPRMIGDDELQLAATYYFQSSKEGFFIQTLSINNDITGDKIGDEPQGSFGVSKIILKYPNKDGFLRTATGSLSLDGKATFKSLEFFAPKDTPAPLEIYVQSTPFSQIGEKLSGETFRLGVQNINNTDSTFKAIGEYSGQTLQGINPSFSSFETNNLVIRKGGPLSVKSIPLSQDLFNGENQLIKLTFESPKNSASLARMTFQLSVSDKENVDLSLSHFKLWNNSGPVEEAVIYDATGNQDLSTGTLGNGLSQVIVTFDQEQWISSNASQNEYYLTAEASNVNTGDSVLTRIKKDESPLSGLTALNQENTGKLYVDSDSTAGIFSSVNDFSQVAATDLNLIWSDRSVIPHQYPTISAGVVQSNTGSADWTNGYLLNMDEVKNQILSR